MPQTDAAEAAQKQLAEAIGTGIQENKPFSFVETEKQVLAFWEADDSFQKSLTRRQNQPPYVFYDGPPFATGLPHHGHFVASVIKDVVPRYWTMRGFYVDRRFGWDCHGLPIEHEIDRQLALSTQEAVAQLGIAGYNDACRGIVQRYTSEWRRSITRLGRWVDFDRDYKTMDSWYMESLWWVFKQLWDKGLIYRGTKVMPVSTQLGTVLSNFEANANYQTIQDPAITVLFKLQDEPAFLAAWTTTPWTLPANLAICAGADIDYVKVQDEERDLVFYIAQPRLSDYAKKNNLTVIEQLKGSALLGRRYEPLFPYYQAEQENNAFIVLNDDFVTTDEGTGLVHMAPAFGEDDLRVAQAGDVPVNACPVSMNGLMTEEATDFAGLSVREANPLIIRHLKTHGCLYRQDVIEHAYPFCYRSDTPLIYRMIDAWYVNVSHIKDDIIQANQQVHWVPGHIKEGRFGHWLADARDWSISRNRVWGTPLPIWVNDQTGETKCVGSVAELATLSGTELTDLHREHVDAVQFSLPGEAGLYKRIPEVLDCWFESGAMPYAQLHYPFENKDVFERGFPAEFIAEGLDQTRGWFYTLMVLSVALRNQPAFKNVIVNGIVMAEDGKKMSKRLRNYTAPDHLMEVHGADALRLYLISGPLLKGEELNFSDEGVREMCRRVLLPWYNAFKFLATYAQIDRWSPTTDANASENQLDRWILSRLQTLKAAVEQNMAAYQLYSVAPVLFSFIEDLTNWYIRLNRTRFWDEGMKGDKKAAYTTLHQVVYELCLIMAPFTPFLSEALYQSLAHFDTRTGREENDSVHLCDFPRPNENLVDKPLEKAVQSMQALILLGRQQREQKGVHLRTPLRSLTLVHKNQTRLDELKKLEAIIQHELNVRQVLYDTAEENYISLSAKPNFPVLGKRLGKRMRQFQKKIAGLIEADLSELQEKGVLELDGEKFSLDDIQVVRTPREGSDCLTNQHISISLDCKLDDELIAAGQARQVVHLVQRARQALQFQVADRIELAFDGDSEIVAVVEQHLPYICGEVLALRAKQTDLADGFDFEHQVEGRHLRLKLTKAET